MAYNPIFPTTYSPVSFSPLSVGPIQQPQQQVSPQTNIIWVSGEAGAKSYLVAPNTTVQLWDSEAQVIYLKSADASGMPNIKILDYTIRNQQQAGPALTQDVGFATKEEVENLAEELASMKRRLDTMSNRNRKHEKPREVDTDVQS